MHYITEPEKKIPVVAETDILVCGGGFAGFAAALRYPD
jgi:heterodisulfide reductase subunit A-like polyferredoxin